jgi:hypothetical protein
VSFPTTRLVRMPCRRQLAGCAAAAITLRPRSNQAPHMVRAPWLHAQWRGKVEREEVTTAWCPPRSGAGGRAHHVTSCGRGPLATVAFMRVLIFDRAAVRARGFAPAPWRGKDQSNAVVSPSRSLVLGSRRAKAPRTRSPYRGWRALHCGSTGCRCTGVWQAAFGGVRERNPALSSIRRCDEGPAIRSRPLF